mmetsp:Transcript_14554/g.42995  ORF Transcript_14554/g.42995 Transcript_14554/m.42995 type:complete len:90 (-) Transcript_14554:749-1018(-)
MEAFLVEALHQAKHELSDRGIAEPRGRKADPDFVAGRANTEGDRLVEIRSDPSHSCSPIRESLGDVMAARSGKPQAPVWDCLEVTEDVY